MSLFSFVGSDTSLPSTTELTTELSQIPGIGGIAGNVGVDATNVTTALPTASNTSIPTGTQLAQELFAAIQSTGLTSTKTSSSASYGTKTTADYKMKLVSKANSEDSVTFVVTPIIDESRQATYDHLSPVHHPGSIQIYKSTEARTFNITGKFIARTSEEATQNLKAMNLIRSWLMPYYGTGTASTFADKLGAPPDILIFDVYGAQNINALPVVLTSYHWVYSDTCDYIPANDGTPVPVLLEITLSLIESYSPEEYSGFDLSKYKTGDMIGAYTFSATPTSSTSSSTTSSTTSTQYVAPSGASLTTSPTSL